MSRRLLTVGLAVVLAVLGTAAVLIYVHQANARALAGQKAVSVLVAQQVIPAGTPAGTALHHGWLASQRLPAASVPADAVASLTPDLSSLVMSADVQPGQLLLRPALVAATQVTGVLEIPAGMVAVSIDLCLPEDVAGYVRPGSEVAVFDTYASGSLSSQDCGGSHSQNATGAVHTRIVLPKVEVLSVGTPPAATSAGSGLLTQNNANSSSGTATSSQGVLVTLAVTQADAERLIQVSEAGLPYLALITGSSHTSFDSTTVPLFQP